MDFVRQKRVAKNGPRVLFEIEYLWLGDANIVNELKQLFFFSILYAIVNSFSVGEFRTVFC